MTNNLIYLILAILFFLSISGLFSLIKVVFVVICSNRDAHDCDEREMRIAERVASPGFSESISLTRIFCNVCSGALGYVLFRELVPALHPYPILGFCLYAVVAGGVVYTFTVFLPSVVGHLKPDTFMRLLDPVYHYFRLPLLLPAKAANKIYVAMLEALGYDPKFSFLSEEKRDALQADMTPSKEEDALEDEERQMILNIFDFVETPVREIMTPRVDMCAIEVGTSLEETIHILNSERHSRLPVYRDSVDSIIGILSNRDFLEWYTEHGTEKFDLESLVMPAIFVPHHKKIDDLLRELRKNGNQLAIVVDEYGGIAGLVTIEDIVEEIVGEIKDEDDEDEDDEIQKLKDGRYILDPLMTLSDLEYELDISLDSPTNVHVETLSGLIQATLGVIPAAGSEVTIQGYKFRVLKVEGTRMTKVMMILPSSDKK